MDPLSTFSVMDEPCVSNLAHSLIVTNTSELMVTGQLADTPTRGSPTRGLDKSRTGQLADVAGSSCSFKWT